MRIYDSDGDHIPPDEQPEFVAYRKQIEGMLSDVPLTVGMIHRTLGTDNRHWTMDALESLVLVSESVQYGGRRAWLSRELKDITGTGKLNFTVNPYSPPTL